MAKRLGPPACGFPAAARRAQAGPGRAAVPGPSAAGRASGAASEAQSEDGDGEPPSSCSQDERAEVGAHSRPRLTTQDVAGEPENKHWKRRAASPYDPASPHLGTSAPLERLKKTFPPFSLPFYSLLRMAQERSAQRGWVAPAQRCLSVRLSLSLQLTRSLLHMSRGAVPAPDRPAGPILPVGGSWRLVCRGTGDLPAACQDAADRLSQLPAVLL